MDYVAVLDAVSTLGNVRSIGYGKWEVNGVKYTSKGLDKLVRKPVFEAVNVNQLKVRKGKVNEALKESMQELGMLHPVNVGWTGRVIDGAARVRAAVALGWKRIEVVRHRWR